MIRPCLRCHLPLVPDQAVLDDARRAEITLGFLPLRCRHGHTERLPLTPPRSVRFLPTCGYCGEVVTERKAKGRGSRLNHPACREAARGRGATLEHNYVEVEVIDG